MHSNQILKRLAFVVKFPTNLKGLRVIVLKLITKFFAWMSFASAIVNLNENLAFLLVTPFCLLVAWESTEDNVDSSKAVTSSIGSNSGISSILARFLGPFLSERFAIVPVSQ